MNRCNKCAMPDTRPDHVFEDGVCPACLNHNRRPKIDWEERRRQLDELLDRHHGEVLVPSSGGKDSMYQCLTLREMGANVTAVTARTCHLSPQGRANIDNLAKYVRTIEVVPNMTVRRKLNRLGLEWVGDGSHPEHMAIFSTPFRVAAESGKRLLMYGELPQDQYGGPKGSEDAMLMTERWVNEYGGFLGLRPSDFVGVEGITRTDMEDYTAVHVPGVEAHFLGQYIPWDSRRNAKIAADHGMIQVKPFRGNWWKFENIDNQSTVPLHDFMMWLKYGYSRGNTQISVDIREGIVERDAAMRWVYQHEGLWPHVSLDAELEEILESIEITEDKFLEIANNFTNFSLFNEDQLKWGQQLTLK